MLFRRSCSTRRRPSRTPIRASRAPSVPSTCPCAWRSPARRLRTARTISGRWRPFSIPVCSANGKSLPIPSRASSVRTPTRAWRRVSDTSSSRSCSAVSRQSPESPPNSVSGAKSASGVRSIRASARSTKRRSPRSARKWPRWRMSAKNGAGRWIAVSVTPGADASLRCLPS